MLAVVHNLAYGVSLLVGWIVEITGWGVVPVRAAQVDLWPLAVLIVAVIYRVVLRPCLVRVEHRIRAAVH